MKNKLPDNFSDMIMVSINTEIARREKIDERIMYCAITGVGTILLGVLAYMAHHYGWFLKIKELFNFSDMADSFANTTNNVNFNPIWIIIFINSLVLIGGFSYITNKKEKEFTPPL